MGLVAPADATSLRVTRSFARSTMPWTEFEPRVRNRVRTQSLRIQSFELWPPRVIEFQTQNSCGFEQACSILNFAGRHSINPLQGGDSRRRRKTCRCFTMSSCFVVAFLKRLPRIVFGNGKKHRRACDSFSTLCSLLLLDVSFAVQHIGLGRHMAAVFAAFLPQSARLLPWPILPRETNCPFLFCRSAVQPGSQKMFCVRERFSVLVLFCALTPLLSRYAPSVFEEGLVFSPTTRQRGVGGAAAPPIATLVNPFTIAGVFVHSPSVKRCLPAFRLRLRSFVRGFKIFRRGLQTPSQAPLRRRTPH